MKGFGLECELSTEGHLRLEAENGDRNTEDEERHKGAKAQRHKGRKTQKEIQKMKKVWRLEAGGGKRRQKYRKRISNRFH